MGKPSRQEGLKNRNTGEVLDDHLRCRALDDIEGDINWNYSDNVIILTSRGAYHGHDGVRELYGYLQSAIAGSEYQYPIKLIEGPYAFIEWRARKPEKNIKDGADSFVIEDGKIVLQTVHYRAVAPLDEA